MLITLSFTVLTLIGTPLTGCRNVKGHTRRLHSLKKTGVSDRQMTDDDDNFYPIDHSIFPSSDAVAGLAAWVFGIVKGSHESIN